MVLKGIEEHQNYQRNSSNCHAYEIETGSRRADCLRAEGETCYVIEPDYPIAQRVALGGFDIKVRPGLSTRQMIERRGRDKHFRQRHDRLAGPEWGTYLGAEHLA